LKKLCIVVGMPRSGTTFLYHTLQKHPSFYLPYREELDYFNFNFSKGKRWYLEFFKDMDHEQIGFDISPAYFLDENTIERIKKFDKNIKVILAVRDPVEFALSCYAQNMTYSKKRKTFRQYINGSYMKRGKMDVKTKLIDVDFKLIIDRYCDSFNENILMYNFDLFKKNPLKILNSIETFLETDYYFDKNNFKNLKINASNRRNIIFISSFLNSEFAMNLLNRFVPSRLIRKTRNYFDKISAERIKPDKNYSKRKDIMIAKKIFKKEQANVSDFFKDGDIILGTRQPFIRK